MTKTNIIVNLQVEGFHNWAQAREVFPEAGFLADRHRHIFHIKCTKAVSHSDRDVEIIMFKRVIQLYLYTKYGDETTITGAVCEFGSKSCEMLSEELLKEFDLEYCSVLEDGENGAEVWKVEI